MNERLPLHAVLKVLEQRPQAVANVFGSSRYPTISGRVYFYRMNGGVLVAAQVTGLPKAAPDSAHRIFGFHIHGGEKCSGTETDPFAGTLTHYDPYGSAHPYHAGDMPPLFGNDGYALQIFFTDRFSIGEIVNKTVVIHSGPDDFTSQPAGNAGEKIACGRIVAFRMY